MTSSGVSSDDSGELGRDALQFLAAAGLALASSLEEAAVVEQAVRLAVPVLAAQCALLPSGEAVPCSTGGASGGGASDPDCPRLSILLQREEEPLGTLTRGTLARGTLARGTLARGTLALGTLVLTRAAGHEFQPADRALAVAFGERVAQALANARKHRRLQEQVREFERRETEARDAHEQERKRGGEDFARFLNSSPLAIAATLNAECHPVLVNAALARLLRITPDDSRPLTPLPDGAPCYHFRKDGGQSALEDLPLHWAAKTGVEVRNVEFEVVHPDGATFALFGHAIPFFDDEGRIKSCLAAFVDITSRRKAEAALAEADRNKDAFLALLSHELRTPLAAMSNAVYLLRRRVKNDLSLTRPCSMLERQLQHAVRLVEDLADVSRIKRGRLQLERARVDLVELARHALELLGPQAEARKLQVFSELPSQAIYGEVDPGRMQQVLTNLLGNAIKYTDPGGQVWFTVEPHRAGIRMVVKDTGIGISPDLLSTAFDLYRQADGALTRSQGGMGLGLALTRGLVEMHGGSISAHSDGTDCGSKFTVLLPLTAPEKAAEGA